MRRAIIGGYSVDDQGTVFDRSGERMYVWTDPEDGYQSVLLAHPKPTRKGQRKRYFVHALVNEAFNGARPPGMQTRHLDGDPGNNAATNLAWGTPKQNHEDQVAHGRRARGARGHGHGFRLDETIVRRIRELVATQSDHAVAREIGCSPAMVYQVKKRKAWAHVA